MEIINGGSDLMIFIIVERKNQGLVERQVHFIAQDQFLLVFLIPVHFILL